MRITKFLLSGSLILGLSGSVLGFEGDYYRTGYRLLEDLISNDLKRKSEEVFNCLCSNETLQLLKFTQVKKELSDSDKKLKSILLKKQDVSLLYSLIFPLLFSFYFLFFPSPPSLSAERGGLYYTIKNACSISSLFHLSPPGTQQKQSEAGGRGI